MLLLSMGILAPDSLLSVKVSVNTLFAIRPQGEATPLGLEETGVPFKKVVPFLSSEFMTTGVQLSLTSSTVRS